MKLFTRNFLMQYIFSIVIFICLDMVWISQVAQSMYRSALGPILTPEPRWVPALAFYLIYILGLWFLAIRSSSKAKEAALRGAVLGLTAYGTYALTGMALFNGWTWSLTLFDCGWGIGLSALVAYLTRKIMVD
jgi:uncharacterized membrane protein